MMKILFLKLLILTFFLFEGCGEEEEEVINAVLQIDASSIKGEVSNLIFGHFIENLGKCIYGGIWDEESSVEKIYGKMRKDVLEAVKALNPPVIRFPGGLYADVYDWRMGIGPGDLRPVIENPYWSFMGEKFAPPDTNRFGTDEFFKFLRYVGGEAYIQVNYSTLPPDVARDWVEYVNGSTSTPYGMMRFKNTGEENPYNAKIWGIGNEIWGWWAKGHTNAENYALRYLQFKDAMKSADPNILLTAAGYNREWNRKFLSLAGTEVDYLTLHVYLPGGNVPFIPLQKKYYYSIVASPLHIKKMIEEMYEDIVSVLGENSPVTVALDEWNVSWRMNDVDLGLDFTMREAIFTAGVIIELIKLSSEGKVGMANFAQLVNMMGLIYTQNENLILTPPYYSFKLVKELRNIYVPEFSFEGKTFNSDSFGEIPPMKNVPFISAVPALRGKEAFVLFLNRSFDRSGYLTISFKDCVNRDGSLKIMKGQYCWSKEVMEENAQFTIKCSKTIKIPPCSMGMIKVKESE